MTFKDWLHQEFRPKVHRSARVAIPDLATELVDSMLRFAQRGDAGASASLREYLHCEAEKRIKDWSRNADQINVKRRDKQRRKPSRYSFTEVDEESGDLIGRAHRSFWDLPREEFDRKFEEIANQAEAMNDTHSVFISVWRVWQRHPDAQTARQAWEADGRQTDEIDLDGMAI